MYLPTRGIFDIICCFVKAIYIFEFQIAYEDFFPIFGLGPSTRISWFVFVIIQIAPSSNKLLDLECTRNLFTIF
jgi:hypothetical protein